MSFTKVAGPGIHTLSNITSHNIHSSGIITAVGLDVDGPVSIGGTLTYEDVTSIDSVGVVTARGGIDCDGDLDVDGHTNLDNVSISGITTSDGDIDLISNDAQLLLEYPGRTRAHITANYYDRLDIATNSPSRDIRFGYTQYSGNSSSFANPPRTIFFMDMGEESFKVNQYGVGYGVTLNGTGNATFTGIVTAASFKLADGSEIGAGAGGTWSSYTAGIATSKSVGINTNNLDDNDLVGVGNSFSGLYISNGMMVMDNKLSGNHYIGTSFNGLMAGPVTVEGTLTVEGNYVVV